MKKWTQANGTKINVRDMNEFHLENALKKARNQKRRAKAKNDTAALAEATYWVDGLVAETKRRASLSA